MSAADAAAEISNGEKNYELVTKASRRVSCVIRPTREAQKSGSYNLASARSQLWGLGGVRGRRGPSRHRGGTRSYELTYWESTEGSLRAGSVEQS